MPPPPNVPVPPDALTGLLVAPKTARHAFVSAYPAGRLHRASPCCTENNRHASFGNAPERDKAPDGQTNARSSAALYHRVPKRHARMGAGSTTACRRLRSTGRHYGNRPVYRRPIEIVASSPDVRKLILSLGAFSGLDQEQEPERARREAGSRRGLGAVKSGSRNRNGADRKKPAFSG